MMPTPELSRALSEYHNGTVRHLRADEDNPRLDGEAAHRYDACNEIAIDLLGMAGYEFGEPDECGDPIEQDVQTLLELAMFRSPRLMKLLSDFAES